MIFSILTPRQFETFKTLKKIDYNSPVEASFLMDMEFGPDLIGDYDEYGYGSTGEKENVCFLGSCKLSNYRYFFEYLNCSISCLENIRGCYYYDTKCYNMLCSPIHYKGENTSCKFYSNKVNKWRDTGVYKKFKKYEYIPLQHIISTNDCPANYKKCGKVNIGNYLCLRTDDVYGCPINQIVITENNTTPKTTFKYKSYNIGDKKIFFTNENVEGYLIQDLYHKYYQNYIPSDLTNKIDSDSFINFLKYNPDTYSGQFELKNKYNYMEPRESWTSFLLTLNYYTNITLKDMQDNQNFLR